MPSFIQTCQELLLLKLFNQPTTHQLTHVQPSSNDCLWKWGVTTFISAVSQSLDFAMTVYRYHMLIKTAPSF